MYRDVPELQDKNLVSLNRELKLASRYLYLQEMRFGKSFQFSLPSKSLQAYQIVPLSIQLLMENAFKHNRFSAENPMNIDVQIKEGHLLVVRNSRNENHSTKDSPKLGMDNLSGRYQCLTGKNIDIIHFDVIFEVHTPLIEVDDA
jgi:sensor histidine kinase YesM